MTDYVEDDWQAFVRLRLVCKCWAGAVGMCRRKRVCRADSVGRFQGMQRFVEHVCGVEAITHDDTHEHPLIEWLIPDVKTVFPNDKHIRGVLLGAKNLCCLYDESHHNTTPHSLGACGFVFEMTLKERKGHIIVDDYYNLPPWKWPGHNHLDQTHVFHKLATQYNYRVHVYKNPSRKTFSLKKVEVHRTWLYVVFLDEQEDPVPVFYSRRKWYHCAFGTDRRTCDCKGRKRCASCAGLAYSPAYGGPLCKCESCVKPKGCNAMGVDGWYPKLLKGGSN